MAEDSPLPEQSFSTRVETAQRLKQLQNDDYHIGWVCATSQEYVTAQAMLDEEHEVLPTPLEDQNSYTLGSVCGHNVVIAYSTTMTRTFSHVSTTVACMVYAFQSIRLGLMVGVGSGIPSKVNIGDVVVSSPVAEYQGVVQWDTVGKVEEGGKILQTGFLDRPPIILLNAFSLLHSEHDISGSKITEYLHDVERRYPRLVPKFTRRDGNRENTEGATTQEEITVHYGLIASGHKVGDAKSRDSVDEAFGGNVLCLDTEAAHLMSHLACVLIRGISDYADSKDTRPRQEYAAMVAAAYAKELLGCVNPSAVEDELPAKAILEDDFKQIDSVRQTRKASAKLEGDQSDTLADMGKQSSTYRNQGHLGELGQFDSQAMETHRQTPVPSHLNSLEPPLELTAGDTENVDFVDSDSSTENNSVFSFSGSIHSTTSFNSGGGEMDLLLIQEFANLLNEDRIIISLLSIGISREASGFGRMRNNFRRLLKHFANDLKADVVSEPHRDLRRFIHSYSLRITFELFDMAHFDDQQKNHTNEHGIASVEKRSVDERKVESYLQSLHKAEAAAQASDDEESDQESVAEETVEDEPYEGSLQNLDQIKHFILDSTAYQVLRRRLEDFVRPSLSSKLRALVTRWSNPEHKNHVHVAQYKIRNLVADLQHVDPDDVRFERDVVSSRFAKFISYYQYLIESRTGEAWDWWPLPCYVRPLTESEARIRWKCVCGEERWAEVPNTLVKRLQSIVRSLPIGKLAAGTTQSGSKPQDAKPSSSSSHNSSSTSHQSSLQAHRVNKTVSSLPNPSVGPSGLGTGIFNMNITPQRVLFLVKQGGDYKLSQICVNNMTCRAFFGTMKKEYFRLRGFFRGWFSIWRYSHCDFYKFEKFDGHEFTLRIKDSFPSHANTDYEYQPKPMDNIPPISEHEFTKRFYACHQPRPLLHLHHDCRRLGGHSSDVLQFLPKKKTELAEDNNDREVLWGIFAREQISLRWILLYNFICVSPFLAFFLAWIVPGGFGTDLQNPSTPLAMMVAMLSLFWSVYLGSLQFGKSR